MVASSKNSSPVVPETLRTNQKFLVICVAVDKAQFDHPQYGTCADDVAVVALAVLFADVAVMVVALLLLLAWALFLAGVIAVRSALTVPIISVFLLILFLALVPALVLVPVALACPLLFASLPLD
jgi:hypothetical protein